MQLTKLTHASVRLEKDGATLVIDPGSFTEPDALDGADAVLITHEHPDHMAPDRFAGLGRSEVYTTPGVAGQLEGTGARVHVVGDGDRFEVAGFDVAVIGELHAVVHPEWPRLGNVGFLVDGHAFHPGDAFNVPGVAVDTLLVPVHGPWMKAPEMIDFVREIAPRQAYPIHDGFLNDRGLGLVDNLLRDLAERYDAEIRRLSPGEQIDLDA
jgi:L-ascorbate metabolism protein UlaG (beta-lactamase superfamily)